VRTVLPTTGTLYTYNGHCFDLTCLRRQLGLDLRACFASVDLRWVCQRQGLRGGQKLIEKRLGHQRQLPELEGRDAILLWARYQRGDRTALATLLNYNREDLPGMMFIRHHLGRSNLLRVSRSVNQHAGHDGGLLTDREVERAPLARR